MGNQSINMGKALDLNGLSNFLKNFKRWNLLFVDYHGRVISLQQIRGLLILCPVVLLVLLSFIICMHSLHERIKKQDNNLQNAIEHSRQELKAMQQEMPALMLRLAEAQYRTPKGAGSKKSSGSPILAKNISTERGHTESLCSASHQSDQKDMGTTKTASVSDFSASYNAELNALNVQFLIRNANKASPDISGYIFVIMKQNDHGQKGWFPIPAVELISGIPSRIKSGEFFKIRNFKIAKFHSCKIVGPRSFNKAKVLLFSPTGDLFYEKIFCVKIIVPEIPVFR